MMNKFRINVTRDQWIAVAKIVLVAMLAIAAVFGYDLGVIQPREQSLQISSALSGIATRAAGGVTRFTSNLWLQNSGMTIDKTLDVTGVSTLSGGVVGDVTGNLTGNVTGNISGSATSPVVTATTRITTPLITVNGVATVGSLSTAGDVSARAITATGQITGASLTVNGAASVGGAATVGSLSSAGDVSVRAVTATGQITTDKLYIGAVPFTGPVKVISGTVANNGTIAHGLSAAPTYVGGCTPWAGPAFTYTLYISGTPDATNVTLGIYDQVGNVPGEGTFVVNCMVIP